MRKIAGKSTLLKAVAFSLILGLAPVSPLFAGAIVKKAAVQTGVAVHSNDKAAIDASNLAEGYVMIKYTGGRDTRIKVQIAKQGGATYSYDLNAKGVAEHFALTEDDGKYTITVFENIAGSKYTQAYSTTLELKLRDKLLPYLYANQYVNFNEDSKVAKKAKELAKDTKTDLEALANIYYYVTENLTYDDKLAAAVPAGYLPDVEKVLETKKGICFDYAALMAAMLRLEGIPSKLVVGYAGSIYHAWINVYIKDVGWIDQVIYFDGEKWSLMDPTFVSTSKSANAVKEFINEGNSYNQKFVY